MVGRMFPPGIFNTFNDAVVRLHSSDLVSKSIAQEVLADQDQPGATGEVMGRVGLVQDTQQAMECLLIMPERFSLTLMAWSNYKNSRGEL